MTGPFDVTVYGHDFTRKGGVAYQSLSCTVRHNQKSNLSLVLPAYTRVDGQVIQTPRLDTLVNDAGARIWVTYNGEHLLSGPKTDYTSEGLGRQKVYTFEFADDWELFEGMLGWPDPAAPLGSQGVEYYAPAATDAETILKNTVTANRSRMTPAITVATNQHRGSTISGFKSRFHPLTDRLMPLIDGAGIGATVRQSGSGVLVDVYAQRDHWQTITEGSGILGSLSLSWHRPEATDTVVGGKGTGVARAFSYAVDGGTETALGRNIESFLDATDADTETDRVAKGVQYLVEHATKVGISATLNETDSFRFMPSGDNGTVRLGDRITIVTDQGVTYTDVLRAVSLSHTDKGVIVTPQIGERSDTDTTVMRAVIANAKAVRQQGLGR